MSCSLLAACLAVYRGSVEHMLAAAVFGRLEVPSAVLHYPMTLRSTEAISAD